MGVGIWRLICGAVSAFCFPELCLNCWWPLGIPGGMRTQGQGRGVMYGKPSSSRGLKLWAPAAVPVPEPLKRLAETSPYHTAYDKADGKTEAGMRWICLAHTENPLGSALGCRARGETRRGRWVSAVGASLCLVGGKLSPGPKAAFSGTVSDPAHPSPHHTDRALESREIWFLVQALLEFSLKPWFPHLQSGDNELNLLCCPPGTVKVQITSSGDSDLNSRAKIVKLGCTRSHRHFLKF